MGEIDREGKAPLSFEQNVELAANEEREAQFSADTVRQLLIAHPDLWWPYQWGQPNLYHLKLRFEVDGRFLIPPKLNSAFARSPSIEMPIINSPTLGGGGNFYLQVNGVDFLIRGADYEPDLLYQIR